MEFANSYESLDYNYILEEFVAKFMEGTFTIDEGVRDFFSWITNDSGYSVKKQKSVIRTIIDALERFIEKIRSLINDNALTNPIALVGAEVEAVKAAKMRRTLLDGLDEIAGNTPSVSSADSSLQEGAKTTDWAAFAAAESESFAGIIGEENAEIIFGTPSVSTEGVATSPTREASLDFSDPEVQKAAKESFELALSDEEAAEIFGDSPTTMYADDEDLPFELVNEKKDNSRYSDYDKPITQSDILTLRNIGKKSVNDFTSNDIQAAQKWAHKFQQQLGTKSPFFRAWSGDWRAHDIDKVQIATKSGISHGKILNNDTRWNIQVPGKSRNETSVHLSTKAREAQRYLSFFDDIVSNAVLLDSVVSKNGGQSLFMHSFYAVADIGNGKELLKLYVEEMNDPNSDEDIKRSYMLQNIEKQQSGVRGSGNNPSRITQTADVNTISDLFELVKHHDKNFKPKPVNKALLNEDGTPKVFYHGTDAQFTAFDPAYISSDNKLGLGFYFNIHFQ